MDHDAHPFVTATFMNTLDDPDLSSAPIVEVTVWWGDDALNVQHLEAPYHFALEAEKSQDTPSRGTTFLLPETVLGAQRLPLVSEGPRGPVLLLSTLPADAAVYFAGQGTIGVRELAARARSTGSVVGHDAVWPLGPEPTELRLGAFRIVLSMTTAAKPVPRVLFTSDGHDLTYFALSFLSAAGVLASAAFFSPPLSLTAAEGLNRNDLILMQQYLDAAAEREEERKIEVGQSNEQSSGGEPGEHAHGSEGAMGENQSVQRNRRYQVEGPPDNPDPRLARKAALQDATTFGAIGILDSMMAGSNAPTAPWGHESALGMDATSANGAMWADDIGTAFGSGGFGLTSLGDGGGGIRDGIGVGTVGTFNRGMGGEGENGFGKGHGHVQGSHRVKAPRVDPLGTVLLSGRLPPQVIQRVVRQNHGRFRVCYERGLVSNPSLEGRVNVRFVIGRTGAVTNVANGGSSLPASDVVNCVVRAFYGLSFPAPEGGIVTVSYPLSFSPG